ncbi:hypothetical protein B0H17DRAFT_1062732 [Mycena rosella]|uniref:Uncharacterized protein n=1 Tax=Mycena rosella TaxID=1033263 RepID=A0AAD7DI39_MYCRO|nr:hypothetical protein B0H17DRAFT_1062732 [Mycena rosella]
MFGLGGGAEAWRRCGWGLSPLRAWTEPEERGRSAGGRLELLYPGWIGAVPTSGT